MEEPANNPLAKRDRLVDRACKLVEESLTSLSNPGICIACEHEQDGCEPDARNYSCENCGQKKVFGAQELLIILAI